MYSRNASKHSSQSQFESYLRFTVEFFTTQDKAWRPDKVEEKGHRFVHLKLFLGEVCFNVICKNVFKNNLNNVSKLLVR